MNETMLNGRGEAEREADGFLKGLAVGSVTDNRDPEGLARVRVPSLARQRRHQLLGSDGHADGRTGPSRSCAERCRPRQREVRSDGEEPQGGELLQRPSLSRIERLVLLPTRGLALLHTGAVPSSARVSHLVARVNLSGGVA